MCWHELATRDLEAACDFFEGLFGWTSAVNPLSPAAYKTLSLDGTEMGGALTYKAFYTEGAKIKDGRTALMTELRGAEALIYGDQYGGASSAS